MISTGEEEEIRDFLLDPSTHEVVHGPVAMIETHAARVFLAGDRALKIKRHVRLPFLDFSTLPERHRACAREFEINRPAAPELYLGLRRVTREASGELALDGSGATIEWAVAMRRFDGEDLMARIADRQGIDDPLAKALADMAHRSHEAAPVAGPASSRDAHGKIIADVVAVCSSSGEPDIVAAGAEFADKAMSRLSAVSDMLDRRSAAGFRRRCHGDLHLGNIVLWQGRPVPFDAIEFDEGLATIDVLYDLAFLVMDLDHRGLARAASLVLNRYLWLADEQNVDALAALPLFLGIRAGIRAMVAIERDQLSGANAASGHAEARRYLASAFVALSPPPPCLIAIGGLSGSGKSTVAAGLAPGFAARPGALHLRSDLVRKRLFGVAESDRLPPAAYEPAVSDQVYARLIGTAGRALAAGHSVIVDAVHARESERTRIAQLAHDMGMPFHGLWLEGPIDVLAARVETRVGDASDATPAVVGRQATFDLGQNSWVRIDAAHPPDVVIAEVRRQLRLSEGSLRR